MKKIKLDTNALRLKREEISNLTSNEMKQIVGGDAPAITNTCVTDGCGTTDYQCTTTVGSTQGNNCPGTGGCGTDMCNSAYVACTGSVIAALCKTN